MLRIAADALVVLHLGFIVFALLGGLLVLKWRWLAFLHLPAATWGALVELRGWVCPLTPLEQQWRQAGGEAGYSGGFVEHYLLPVLYPAALTRNVQLVLGLIVIAVNLAVYAWLLVRLRRAGPA